MICEPAMPTITEFNRIEDLESLRLTWSALLPQTPGLSFFHTLDWLKAYWRHFGGPQQLRVLLVTSGSKPIGILPLTVVRESTRVGNVRVLTYPLHDWGTYFGPIGPNPTATLTLAMQHIRDTARDWDMLDMRWVNRDAHDHLRTRWAMEHAGFSVREDAWKTTAMIDLDGCWDDYWASRSSKFRHEVSRQERRLMEGAAIEHIRYRPRGAIRGDADPRWDLYDACEDIARQSWQGVSTTGTTLSHASVREFFRETHALAAKNGMLDVNILTVDGRPAAFGYNYCSGGQLFGLRAGYLPEFAKCGVGKVLAARLLRDSFERGDQCLDMGVGSLDVKRKWMTRHAQSYRYTHYPFLAPRAQLLRLKHLSGSSAVRGDTELAGV